MFLFESTFPPVPYQAALQFILAGFLCLLEIIVFGFSLWSLNKGNRCYYLIALLILIAANTFLLGQAFNEHFYVEYLHEELGADIAKGGEAVLYRLKELFTISSCIGLMLATITLLLKIWRHQKTA